MTDIEYDEELTVLGESEKAYHLENADGDDFWAAKSKLENHGPDLKKVPQWVVTNAVKEDKIGGEYDGMVLVFNPTPPAHPSKKPVKEKKAETDTKPNTDTVSTEDPFTTGDKYEVSPEVLKIAHEMRSSVYLARTIVDAEFVGLEMGADTKAEIVERMGVSLFIQTNKKW